MDNVNISIGNLSMEREEGICRPKNLNAVFHPQSVAVVGASTHPEKIGHQVLLNIIEGGFQGEVIPIHPRAGTVLSKKAYASIEDVPDRVDLVLIAVPAAQVPDIVAACGRKNVQAVAVISSGFGEAGHQSEEAVLKDLADEYGIALLGPNMLGVVYMPGRLNASFGPKDVEAGRIAFISQSGALAIALMGWAKMKHIGLAAVVTLGNKVDIEEKELIDFFQKDDEVDVTLVYIEGLKDGRKFMDVNLEKPVVALKVGTSRDGAHAAVSHTGSLAGADQIYDAAFKQKGILRARTFREAFGWSRTLSLPLPKGEDILIITNGGGIGVRTTDECEARQLPLLRDEMWLEEHFRGVMPDFGSTGNPIDLTGQAREDRYHEACRIAFEEERIHAVIVLYCETNITDPMRVAESVVAAYEEAQTPKPLVVVMVGGERTRQAVNYFNRNRVPAFTAVGEAVSGLSALYQWKEISGREPASTTIVEACPPEALAIVKRVKGEGRPLLLEQEAFEVLEHCGIPTPPRAFARDLEEAIFHAQDLYPLALKISAIGITHKTDVDGVRTNIRNEEELRVNYKHMMDCIHESAAGAEIVGVNLVQMVQGIECILGLHHDPQFGPVVMFGLGGVFVEMLKDVSFRIVPFDRSEAERLLRDIRGDSILDGFRGYQAHRESLKDAMIALQKLADHVQEIDINPMITNASGSYAVDARILV